VPPEWHVADACFDLINFIDIPDPSFYILYQIEEETLPGMKLKHKIWIEKDGKVLFGRGRDDILTAVRDQRSLNAAAKKLQMSYRAAWGRLKASEERMGMRLVEIDATEKGMHLTAKAEALIGRFEELEKDLDKLLAKAERDFQKLIQGP
jgi:molybdate transport system regulatory protein